MSDITGENRQVVRQEVATVRHYFQAKTG